MTIQFRNYTKQPGITEDYFKVRSFLVKLGHSEYTYARWDWMTTHGCLDMSAVGKIGIWENNGEIAGLATFDCKLGIAYCLTLPEYVCMKKEILLYARDNLAKDGKFGVVISDADSEFQDIAAGIGFVATDDKENDAVFYLE